MAARRSRRPRVHGDVDEEDEEDEGDFVRLSSRTRTAAAPGSRVVLGDDDLVNMLERLGIDERSLSEVEYVLGAEHDAWRVMNRRIQQGEVLDVTTRPVYSRRGSLLTAEFPGKTLVVEQLKLRGWAWDADGNVFMPTLGDLTRMHAERQRHVQHTVRAMHARDAAERDHEVRLRIEQARRERLAEEADEAHAAAEAARVYAMRGRVVGGSPAVQARRAAERAIREQPLAMHERRGREERLGSAPQGTVLPYTTAVLAALARERAARRHYLHGGGMDDVGDGDFESWW